MTSLIWDDEAAKLTLGPKDSPEHRLKQPQKLRVELIPGGKDKLSDYTGEAIMVDFE